MKSSIPEISENRFMGSLSTSSIRNLLHRSISAKQKRNPNVRDAKTDIENAPPLDPNIVASQRQCQFTKRSLSKSSAFKNHTARSDGQNETLASVVQITGSDINDGIAETSDPSVKVVVRIKRTNEETRTVRKVSSDSLSVGDRKFTFDSVLDSNSNQEDIFQLVGVPLVRDALSGFNSSILSYGQTGSGKTYTMWGPPSAMLEDPSPYGQQGLVPRIFQMLFSEIQREKTFGGKQINYQCRCSCLEIYNGQIDDLLDQTQRNLEIKDEQKNGFYVENLSEEYVNSYEDVAQILMKGLSSRKVGTTGMNPKSSRSHVVFSFIIESWCKGISPKCFSTTRTSRINLVDLAGAERIKLDGESKQCAKEQKYLKKSLSQLGNVVNALTTRAQPGISQDVLHRCSRLTHLLQESLGGNAKLTVICAISPDNKNTSEMLSTLRFGERVKSIANEPVINEISEEDVNDLSDQIRRLKEELIRAKADVYRPTGTKSGYYRGRSARESLNQLRVSLNRSLILPKIDTDDDDDEEEQEEATVDEHDARELHQQLNKLHGSCDENPRELSDDRDSIHSSFVSASCGPDLISDDEIDSCETEFEDADLEESHKEWDGKDIPETTEDSSEASRVVSSALRNSISVDPCRQSLSLQEPILSESPKIRNSLRKSVAVSSSAFLTGQISMSESSKFESPRKSRHIRSPLRTSRIFPGPRESLTASLQRGLQIIDLHQRNSLNRSSVSFSFENLALNSCVDADSLDTSVHMLHKAVSPTAERSLSLVCPSCKQTFEKTFNEIEDSSQIPVGVKNPDEPTDQDCNGSANNDMEEVSSKDKVLENLCKEQAGKIEELNCLLELYKNQNENKTIPLEDSRNRNQCPPANKNKLQNCNDIEDHQPEVIKETYETKPVQEDDGKTNFDTNEKETLLKEVENLKSQLQNYAAASPTKSADKLRFQLSRSIQLRKSVDFRNITEEELEKERLKWTTMESEWISLTDELRVIIETQRKRAEKAETELKLEKLCTEELDDALHRAVLGHARFVEHYTELQEKYNDLAGKNKAMMEWVAEVKRAVAKAGGKKGSRFAKSIAAELSMLRVEKERERMLLKMENKSLKIQLRDTAEAVHAAGELLVRLREAEQAASAAQENFNEAKEENEKLKKKTEKLKRKHKMEMITMKQCLAESRLPESALQTFDGVESDATQRNSNLQEDDDSWRTEFGAIYQDHH